MVDLEQVKWEYNNVLNRYYNGCNYLIDNPNEFDKYINIIMELKSKLDELINIIIKRQSITEDEILGGFTLN